MHVPELQVSFISRYLSLTDDALRPSIAPIDAQSVPCFMCSLNTTSSHFNITHAHSPILSDINKSRFFIHVTTPCISRPLMALFARATKLGSRAYDARRSVVQCVLAVRETVVIKQSRLDIVAQGLSNSIPRSLH